MHDTLTPPFAPPAADLLPPGDSFARRHLGSSAEEVAEMLAALDLHSLDALIGGAVPARIRLEKPLSLPPARGEHETLAELRSIAAKNKEVKNSIGQGDSGTNNPPVIQRN